MSVKRLSVSADLFNQLTAERVWILQALERLLVASAGQSEDEIKARIHAQAVLAAMSAQ